MDALWPGQIVFGVMFSERLRQQAVSQGLMPVDWMRRPGFVIGNAALTAEGAVGLLLQESERSLSVIMDSIRHEHTNKFTGEVLPPSPASAPFAIFKQSSETVRTSVIIGLGSKLQIMQSKEVRNITSYPEIDLELPGKTAKDVELSLEPEAVVIADKPAETTDAATGKAVKERPAWSRRLDLPFRVNADKANAKFTNGILRIELPKAEAAGVKRIAIEG